MNRQAIIEDLLEFLFSKPGQTAGHKRIKRHLRWQYELSFDDSEDLLREMVHEKILEIPCPGFYRVTYQDIRKWEDSS